MPANTTDLDKRLWDVANGLRANAGLRSSEYSTPVLGLIFLRFAEARFAPVERELAGAATGRRTIGPADYQARRRLPAGRTNSSSPSASQHCTKSWKP